MSYRMAKRNKILKAMHIWLIAVCASLFCGCSKSRNISIKFEDVGLLRSGDPIIYRGLKIGIVKDIKLYNGSVVVSTKIDMDAPVCISDTGQIQHSGMFGERQIVITPGSSKTFASRDDTLNGIYKTIKPQSITALSELVDTMQSVRERFLVKQLIDSIGTLNARIKMLELQAMSPANITENPGKDRKP